MGTFSDLRMLKDIVDFNIEVITADLSDKDSVGFALTGKKITIPHGNDPCYIERLLGICGEENITTIIPQRWDELQALSANMKLFENRGIKVLVTEDIEKLITANNKKSLYDFFKGRDFIPDYVPVSNLKELEDALSRLGYPLSPVCIKPVLGEGGKGVKIVTSENIDIFNDMSGGTKISFDILKQQIMKAHEIPPLLATEYLPGTEYSVDCVSKGGEAYVCIPRQRLETSIGVATISLIERNEELIELSREIISKLNLSYNVNLQFKYSACGRPKLVEVNPRVSGSLVANLGAGVNMLELALKLAYDMPLEDININWGTKMIRYWDQIFITVSENKPR